MYKRNREDDGSLSLEARIWLKVGYMKGRLDERKDNIELYERQEEFGFAYLLTLIDELEDQLQGTNALDQCLVE